jgi:hypothetical protein
MGSGGTADEMQTAGFSETFVIKYQTGLLQGTE